MACYYNDRLIASCSRQLQSRTNTFDMYDHRNHTEGEDNMGSGEGDAIRNVKVDSSTPDWSRPKPELNWKPTTTNVTTPGVSLGSFDTTFDNTWTYYPTPTTIYKYQVKCPSCKKMNWLELDKITKCLKCTSKLKAVLEEVDYEVTVEK